MGPLWKADRRIAIAKSRFEGGDKLRGIQKTANVGFGEVRIGHSFGCAAALFYRRGIPRAWGGEKWHSVV
jgi:hypothetical protein